MEFAEASSIDLVAPPFVIPTRGPAGAERSGSFFLEPERFGELAPALQASQKQLEALKQQLF